MDQQQIIIAGIDTEIGKTVVSAIFCEALQADYWKPVQAGDLHCSDSDKVRALISNAKSYIHPEGQRLQQAMSPHAAAYLEGIEIDISQLTLPKTNNRLIVELAGGLMVPLNHRDLNLDLVRQLQLPIVLVSKYYLGNINHTLLSWQLLKQYDIPFLGFVFNGNQATFDIILEYTKAPCLLEIEEHDSIHPQIIQHYARQCNF